jgi:hypothetical protein
MECFLNMPNMSWNILNTHITNTGIKYIYISNTGIKHTSASGLFIKYINIKYICELSYNQPQ